MTASFSDLTHSNDHASESTLQAYVSNQLDADAIEAVEQHLANCLDCATHLDNFSDAETDPFASRVRNLLAGSNNEATVCPEDLNSEGSSSNGPSSGDPNNAQQAHSRQRDRFKRQEIIGSGGMGHIWRAHDTVVNRVVALKQLKEAKAWSPKHLARFEREVMLTARLSHPGSTFVIDYCPEPGHAFYAMNLVEGETLANLIGSYYRQTAEACEDDEKFSGFIRLLTAFISVCNSIAYAHSRQVVHRDIKSDNVMVGKFGEVTVLDWGLAKDISDKSVDVPESSESSAVVEVSGVLRGMSASLRTTMEGQSIGTPAFMSPEQARGEIDEIDFRTDTYCLSAMLYEILTGQPPFMGTDVKEVIASVIDTVPDPARKIIPDCPATLESICIRGLAKDKQQRFQTAQELADKVQRWISGRAKRKSADLYMERFFELAFDAMGIVDFREGLQSLNPAWTTSFGWDPQEITGKTHYEMIHPEDQVRAARALSRANKTKRTQQVEVRLLCKDGSYKRSQWSLAPYVEEASVFIIGRLIEHDA